jgi:hypothetical protein
MRRILLALALLAFASPALAQNYQATQGSGTTFGAKSVSSVLYPQIVFCDPTTPANCVGVNGSGQMTVLLGGTLPAFASTPTFNLGTLNGAATSANQTAINTSIGTTNTTLGTTADAPCSLPASTTPCSGIALQKAQANAVINPVPLGSASGGLSTSFQNALLATVVAVDASAGQLYELYCFNPNASVAFVQLFDLATGSVTLGTTAPKLSYGIPATSASGFTVSLVGTQFSTAISAAATTTSNGSTAPGSGLNCNFKFK